MARDNLQNRNIGVAFLTLAAGLGFLAAFGAAPLMIAAAVGAGIAGGIGALFTLASFASPAAGDDHAEVPLRKQAGVTQAQEKICAEPLLSNAQIVPLLAAARVLEKEVEPLLAVDLREKLVDLQKRAGEAFNAGQWSNPKGEIVQVNPPAAHPPTRQEAQAILGAAYLEVSHSRNAAQCLAALMDEMKLIPSAPVRTVNADGPQLRA